MSPHFSHSGETAHEGRNKRAIRSDGKCPQLEATEDLSYGRRICQGLKKLGLAPKVLQHF